MNFFESSYNNWVTFTNCDPKLRPAETRKSDQPNYRRLITVFYEKIIKRHCFMLWNRQRNSYFVELLAHY